MVASSRTRGRSLALALLLASVFTMTALAAQASAVTVGSLSPFSPASCVSSFAAPGCTTSTLGSYGTTSVVSHGSTVYVGVQSGGSGVAAYALNADGSLGARRSCIVSTGVSGCTTAVGLSSNSQHSGIAVAPNGKTLYVASTGSSSPAGIVAAYALNADGSIGLLRSCVSTTAIAGCATSSGYIQNQISVDSRGAFVVTGPSTSGTTVSRFPIDGSGALSPPTSCANQSGTAGCVAVGTSFQPIGPQVHGDNVYVPNYSPGNIVTLSLSTTTGLINGIRVTTGSNPGQTTKTDTAISSPRNIRVTSDGKYLLMTSASTTGGPPTDYQGRILAFALDGNGSIGDRTGCASGTTSSVPAPTGCLGVTTFTSIDTSNFVLSPDDQNVYAAIDTSGDENSDSIIGLAFGGGNFFGPIYCAHVTATIPICLDTPLTQIGPPGISPSGNALYIPGNNLVAMRREQQATCIGGKASTTSGAPVEVSWTCTDPNEDPVTIDWDSAAPNASVTRLSPTTFRYSSKPGFVGTDSFTLFGHGGGLPVTGLHGWVFANITVTQPTIKSAFTELKKKVTSKKLTKFTGTASSTSPISSVRIAVARLPRGITAAAKSKIKRCSVLSSKGKLTTRTAPGGQCRVTSYFVKTRGTTKWSFKLKRRLPKGSYIAISKVTDIYGNVQSVHTRDAKRFTVK